MIRFRFDLLVHVVITLLLCIPSCDCRSNTKYRYGLGNDNGITTTSTSRSSSTRVLARGMQVLQPRKQSNHEHSDEERSLMRPTSAASSFRSIIEQQSMDNLCYVAFANCATNANCTDCYNVLFGESLLWADVDTPCEELLTSLHNKNYCTSINDYFKDAKLSFCQVVEACERSIQYDALDCSTLTECNWAGINLNFIGDGRCHDVAYGCYNTAICQYDGGDCCIDTCDETKKHYYGCGSDGYFCRNPNSTVCTSDDENNECFAWKADTYNVQCNNDSENMYVLNMFDSFGDGWGAMTLTITGFGETVFETKLKTGYERAEYFCLPSQSVCYNVTVHGGIWGREMSWNIVPGNVIGAPSIASGIAPTHCSFMTGDSIDVMVECLFSTPRCVADIMTSIKDPNPYRGQEYIALKNMSNCIDSKCFLQVDACNNNEQCMRCFQEDVPDWCYMIDSFLALSTCATCKCSPISSNSPYCATKVIQSNTNDGIIQPPADCSSTQKSDGGVAVMHFLQCTNFTMMDIMLKHFSYSVYGELDAFEKCAKDFISYKQSMENSTSGANTTDHRSALECMQILVNAMFITENDDDTTDIPCSNREYYPSTVAELAKSIYHNGNDFCDCATYVIGNTPNCPTFLNFKSLLYESLDGCHALDTIICYAWDEYANRCKRNMQNEFRIVDFTSKKQCDYVMESSCGGAGPFPSSRTLNCENEETIVTPENWDFYTSFRFNCISESTSNPDGWSSLAPAGNRNKEDIVEPSVPAEPYIVPGSNDISSSSNVKESVKKPYIPPEDRNKANGKQQQQISSYIPNQEENVNKSPRGISAIIFLCILGFVLYVVHNRRQFTVPYQRVQHPSSSFGGLVHRFFGDRRTNTMISGDGMDGGLNDGGFYNTESRSNTFEIITLPPSSKQSVADHPNDSTNATGYAI